MFGCRTPFLALLLLLFAHYTQTFVLLTANIDDVKKIARKFVSEPLAEQIALFIAKASGQAAVGPNVSAENEQNAGDVQDVSENELEQFSKVARQKYELKNELNRYKQQTRSYSSKAPAEIEFIEDKSETVNNLSQPLIQYKKIKDPVPNLNEYKKIEPKVMYQNLKAEPNEELDLLIGDETTTRQQKRWKKKESGGERQKQDRQQKAFPVKRNRSKKKTDRELNLNNGESSFQLVHQNENNTNNNNKVIDIASSDARYNDKNNDKYNREMKINDKSTLRQYDIDSRQQDFTTKHYERHKSKYRSRIGERQALKQLDEPHTYSTDNPVDAPMYAPMDVPLDEPIEDPMDKNFNNVGVPETITFGELPPRVNAFNIAAIASSPDRKLESMRKNNVVATSGNVILPIASAPEQMQSRQRGDSSLKPL